MSPGRSHGGGALPSVDSLTPRQREVMELIARGLSNDDIGGVLGISTATVRTHVGALLQALQVANRTEATGLYASWTAGPSRTDRVMARPAIAIYPVVVVDPEPRLHTMAAGITADLAGLFARWSWFPVIFDPPKAPPVAAGTLPTVAPVAPSAARFRFSGTLRRHGLGLRLHVSVDDDSVGARLWTERYELELTELFEVEDLVCAAIVAAAYPVLVTHTLAEFGRFPAAVPTELTAWEQAHLAMALQQRRKVSTNVAAEAGFLAALARDPRLVLAHYGLGLVHYDQVLHQTSDRRAALDRLRACAERCMSLAPHAAEGNFLLARFHHAQGMHPLAIAPLELAIRHNPSFAPAHSLLAQFLVLDGRFDEGLVTARHAMRLSPRSQVAGLATVYFVCGHYRDALAAAESALATHPEYPFLLAMAAASARRVGDDELAARHHQVLRALAPTFTTADIQASFGPKVPGIVRFAETLDELDAMATQAPGHVVT